MTIPNTFTNGTVADADEVNQNFAHAQGFFDVRYPTANAIGSHTTIAHSATTWSTAANGFIYQTTDSGGTFTSRNTALDTAPVLIVCKDDITKGFAIELTATGETAYTADSGATWTTKTSAGHATLVYDAAFPTANLIVVAGNDAAGTDHIQRSTDQGTTWTDATTSPGTLVYAVDMFDGTNGFAVVSGPGAQIWKTADGGDTWTNSGHTTSMATDTNTRVVALSATVCVIASNGIIDYYDGSGNAQRKVQNASTLYCTGLVSTNSDLFAWFRNGTSGYPTIMYASKDAGVNWMMKVEFPITLNTSVHYKRALDTYDTGKLILSYSEGTITTRDYSNL